MAAPLLATTLACTGGDDRIDQVARGRELYGRYCRQCHEAEDGIGNRLTPRVLTAYRTAEGLYEYNRRYMPYGAEGRLADDDYRAITAWMLVEHGFAEPGLRLDPDTAAELRLRLPEGERDP